MSVLSTCLICVSCLSNLSILSVKPVRPVSPIYPVRPVRPVYPVRPVCPAEEYVVMVICLQSPTLDKPARLTIVPDCETSAATPWERVQEK